MKSLAVEGDLRRSIKRPAENTALVHRDGLLGHLLGFLEKTNNVLQHKNIAEEAPGYAF